MYLCSFKSTYSLTIKNKIIFDENIPSMTFCFVCRCCENKILLSWSNGVLQMTENYGTPKTHYVTIPTQHSQPKVEDKS